MKIGFEPPDHPDYDPGDTPDDVSSPSHVGDIGQLTTNSDDDNDDPGSITFTHHVYIQVSIGPFTFVVGRPD